MHLQDIAAMFCGGDCYMNELDNWKCAQPLAAVKSTTSSTSSGTGWWGVIRNVFLSNFALSSCYNPSHVYLVNGNNGTIAYQTTLEEPSCRTTWNVDALDHHTLYDLVFYLPQGVTPSSLVFSRVAPVNRVDHTSTFTFQSSDMMNSSLLHTITFHAPPDYGGDCCAVNGYLLQPSATGHVCSAPHVYEYTKTYTKEDEAELVDGTIQYTYLISAMPCLWDEYGLVMDRILPITTPPTLAEQETNSYQTTLTPTTVFVMDTLAPTASTLGSLSTGQIIAIVMGSLIGAMILLALLKIACSSPVKSAEDDTEKLLRESRKQSEMNGALRHQGEYDEETPLKTRTSHVQQPQHQQHQQHHPHGMSHRRSARTMYPYSHPH
jgi:hypothetical protein